MELWKIVFHLAKLFFRIKSDLRDTPTLAEQERQHREMAARAVAMGRPLPPPPLSPEEQAAEQARRKAETEAEVQRILRAEQHRDR